MKSNPRAIIEAHYATFEDLKTGNPLPQDYFLLLGVPIALATACLVFEVQLSTAASAALLATAGLLVSFLFGVMLQVSQRAMDWADKGPPSGPETSSHALFLREISANSAYAALIAIQAAIVFVVATA